MKNLLKIFSLLLITAAPLSASAAGDVFKGKEIYLQKCASCHGANGKGVMLDVPDFTRTQVVLKTYEELAMVVRMGKGMMPGFISQLKDQDVSDVVAYLKTMY